MKRNRYKIIVFLAGLSSLSTLFIFLNSSLNYEKSHNSSQNLTEIIFQEGDAIYENAEVFIRKFAHIIEFFLLGVAIYVFVIYVRRRFQLRLEGYTLFYILLVAVIDEHIQSFSDRTSSTRDILLDFAGAMIGMATVHIIIFVMKCIKKRLKTT